jgi:hypothetical protein
MRIALVNEYFPPHAPGGAEWSVEDALSMLLAEPGRRAAPGRANRARIDAGFRWDRCVVDTVAVYEDAVATRRSAARVPR